MMKLIIDIPKEFENDYNGDLFKDFFSRVLCDIQNGTLCGNYEKEIAEMFLKAFDESNKIDNNGWIACSERLPEIEADVMLSLKSLDVYTGFMANTEGCFYVEGEGYVEAENVLAWMPLPQPYKERDTNGN